MLGDLGSGALASRLGRLESGLPIGLSGYGTNLEKLKDLLCSSLQGCSE